MSNFIVDLYFPDQNSDRHCQSTEPTKCINVLLVGRSHTGKTTIVKTLINPQTGTNSASLFSETNTAECVKLNVFDKNTNRTVRLNFVETPGLNETVNDSDENISKLSSIFVEHNITHLNVVCYVSIAGQTHRLDTEYFYAVKKCFFSEFSTISTMVLTHCDEFTDNKLDEFEHNIKTHDVTKLFYEYCKLGVVRFGALNLDKSNSLEEPVRASVVESILKKTEKMRENFLQIIVSRSESYQKIVQMRRNCYNSQNQQNKIIGERNMQNEEIRNCPFCLLLLKSDFMVSRYLPVDSNLGFGNFFVAKTKCINMLLVGRSQSGKSTIVETLLNPQNGTRSSGFSDTRDPACNNLILTDLTTKQSYQFNIVDTPGLKELRENEPSRSDEELLKLASTCVEQHITTLNIVGFVSKAGDTHRLDIEAFKEVKKFLGDSYSSITMMVLTHGDEYNEEKVKEFELKVQAHDVSRPFFEYCQLGIVPFGALNLDKHEAFDEDVRKGVVQSTLKKVEKMRDNFIKKVLSCADKEVKVSELQQIYDQSKKAQEKVIEEEIRLRAPNDDCVIQ